MGNSHTNPDVALCHDYTHIIGSQPQLVDTTASDPAIRVITDPNWRIHYVCALITVAHLGSGTGSTAVARSEMRSQFQSEFADGDQAGHIIARALGGHTNKENLIIQNGRCNNGAWKNCELTVKNKLQQYQDCRDKAVVFYTVGIKYPLDWSFSTHYRPDTLMMHADFYTEDRQRLLETFTCDVNNPVIGDCRRLASVDSYYGHDQLG